MAFSLDRKAISKKHNPNYSYKVPMLEASSVCCMQEWLRDGAMSASVSPKLAFLGLALAFGCLVDWLFGQFFS
jgi:hypothetical protein